MKVSELSEKDQRKLKEIEAKDRLTRSDLFTLVSLNLRLAEGMEGPDKAAVEKVCMELFGTVVRIVRGNKSISITGFGTFTANESLSRIARNPQTGEKFRAPAKWFPKFLPGALFIQYLNGRPLPKNGPVVGKAPKGSGVATSDYVKAGIRKRRYVKKET